MLWMHGNLLKTSFLLFKEDKIYECKISTYVKKMLEIDKHTKM
jgi:hypothetical protein